MKLVEVKLWSESAVRRGVGRCLLSKVDSRWKQDQLESNKTVSSLVRQAVAHSAKFGSLEVGSTWKP